MTDQADPDLQLDRAALALAAGREHLRRGRESAIEILPRAVEKHGKAAVARILAISRPTLDAWLREAREINERGEQITQGHSE